MNVIRFRDDDLPVADVIRLLDPSSLVDRDIRTVLGGTEPLPALRADDFPLELLCDSAVDALCEATMWCSGFDPIRQPRDWGITFALQYSALEFARHAFRRRRERV
jgi:hypothetical protein